MRRTNCRSIIIQHLSVKVHLYLVFNTWQDGILVLIWTGEDGEICLNAAQQNSEHCIEDSNGGPGALKIVAHRFTNRRCYPGPADVCMISFNVLHFSIGLHIFWHQPSSYLLDYFHCLFIAIEKIGEDTCRGRAKMILVGV